MKKLRRLWKFAMVFVLSLAMLLSNFSLVAFAEKPMAATTLDGSNLFTGIVQTEVELDDSFEIPTAAKEGTVITVIDPKGEDVTPSNGHEVAADRRGIYVVTVTNGDYTYKYNVYCQESGEYTLKVLGENDIPSYVSTGTTVKLPAATFLDEDELEVEDASVVVDILDNAASKTPIRKNPGDEYTFNNEGSIFLTYKISGHIENLFKSYTKTYEVKVQSSFKDDTDPSITVSGVPTSAQLNNKVTLPTGTGRDDIDQRVKVCVEVTAPTASNGSERKIYEASEVDEDTGYALAYDSEKTVVFDNGENMSFYAQYEGVYTIIYYAVDDSGNESAKHKYFLTISTSNAPVLVNEEELDNAIPETWGRNIKNKLTSEVAPVIVFPMPEFRHQDPENNKISVEFTIKSDYEDKIVYFEDIYAIRKEERTEVTATNVNKYNGGETSGVVFTEEGFAFDVSKINAKEFKAGSYTATYKAKAGNRTRTKNITFELKTSYNDKNNPAVEDIEGVEHLFLGKDETYTVPTVVYSDTEDKNPVLEYKLTTGDVSINVEGGEVYDIVARDGEGYKFVDEDGHDVININGDITLTYKVTDNAGNVSDEKEPFVVKVHDMDSVNLTADAFTSNINVDSVDRAVPGLENPNNIDLGGFEIKFEEDSLLYGYEINVLDPDGNSMIFKASRVVTDSSIYVRNISFKANDAGIYTLFVRIFDMKGNSCLYGFNKEVLNSAPSGSNYKPTSAEFTKGNNDINGEYGLPDDKGLSDDLYRVVTLEGRRYSVIGNTFKPMEVGTYKIYKNTIEKAKFDENQSFTEAELDGGALFFDKAGSSTDSSEPVFDLDDIEPYTTKAEVDDTFIVDSAIFTEVNGEITWKMLDDDGTQNAYEGDGAWYVLPRVTAFTSNGEVDRIEIKISYGSSDTMSSTSKIGGSEDGEIRRVYYNTEKAYYTLNEYEATENNELKDGYVFANRWAFFAGEDSEYNIEYTAFASNSSASSKATQKIVVGDTLAPTIKESLANEAGKGFVIMDSDGKTVSNVFKSGNIFFFDFVKENVNFESGNDSESTVEVKFTLSDGNGEVYGSKDFASEWITLTNLENRLGRDRQKDGYVLSTGRYTVTIVVRDENGNESAPKTYEFVVSADSTSMSTPLKVLTWVLSILAGLLIVFVIVYIVRLRRIKK